MKKENVLSLVPLLIAAFVILHWLWSGVFLAEFNSDTADTLFWAAASRDAHAIASPTFHYNYFIPFGDRLLLRPLISACGLGITAMRISMTVFLVVFSAVAFALFRSLRWSRAASWLSVALILTIASATTKMREIYFGHVLYYSLGTLFLFLGVSCAPGPLSEEADSRRAQLPQGFLFALCMAWAASCGKPLLLYAVVPVLGAWLFAQRGFSRSFSMKRDGAVLLPGVVGAIIGFAVFAFLSRNLLPIDYGTSYEGFSPPEQWWSNFGKLPGSWTSLLCSALRNPIPVTGEAWLPVAGQTGLAIVLAIAPIVALFRIRRFSSRERMLVTAHWVLSAEILFFWAVGTISDGNWRLCPVVLSAAAVTACLIRNALTSNDIFAKKSAFWMTGFVVAVCVLIQLQTAFLPENRTVWRESETLVPSLETIGVSDGYCTDYWFANVVTAISGNRFRLREVEPDEKGGWRGRPYLTDNRWFEPDPKKSRTVFVCYPSEEPFAPKDGQVDRSECWQIDTRNDRYAKLVVLVYDGDCMAR